MTRRESEGKKYRAALELLVKTGSTIPCEQLEESGWCDGHCRIEYRGPGRACWEQLMTVEARAKTERGKYHG